MKRKKINKSDAIILARKITQEDCLEILTNAKNGVTDWKAPSRINNSISIGTAFNIFAKSTIGKPSVLAKRNLLMIFSDYIPKRLWIGEPVRRRKVEVKIHQEPDFSLLDEYEGTN